ncbi:unnamed protein product (mitochondrion) [Plasmodiophora brassicae]|uniref:FHA domain-containing protein n=1 Tax=Plasmodiophora brassicae TaxID=37360 RepID=A0A0G4IJX4_PLABS|nr:hypothetical protein PBRA_004229 [Plasmodiophora brassicae]SPR00378.1 unnamed protein product [Plasmodiophora brassicae]
MSSTDDVGTRLGRYIPPRWSVRPEADDVAGLRLEVIRQGVALSSSETIPLDERPFTILGRQPDVCHRALLHPSISRQHAVVQHGPHGAVFINDLGSTHGTVVNKKRLVAGQFHPLRVGDVVRFGQSQRIYCVEGPERLRPPEWQTLQGPVAAIPQRPAAVDSTTTTTTTSADEPDSDAVEESESDDDMDDLEEYLTSGTAQNNTLNDRQRKVVDTIVKRRTKLNHVKKEAETLQSKESINGSLSAGQKAALTRCMEQLATLQAEVDGTLEDLIRRLKDKRRGRKSESSKPTLRRPRPTDDDDENDDFYDRTKATAMSEAKRQKRVKAVETLSSLKAQLTNVADREQELARKIAELQSKAQSAPEETEDELDSYMASIGKAGAAQQVVSMQEKLNHLADERDRLEKLIRIATPAGSHLVPSADWAHTTVAKAISKEPVRAQDPTHEERQDKSGPAVAPEPKQNLLPMSTPAALPTETVSSADTYILPGIDDLQRKGGLLIPKRHSTRRRAEESVCSEDGIVAEIEHVSDWVPPVHQTGDGRTSLNEKLGY